MIRVLGPLNVPMVILGGAESLRDVLNTRTYDFVKFEGLASFLSRIIGYGLILSEGNAHRTQRKAITPSFHIRKIRGLYDLMWEKTGILLAELQKDIDAHRSAGDSGYGRVEMAEWSRLVITIRIAWSRQLLILIVVSLWTLSDQLQWAKTFNP